MAETGVVPAAGRSVVFGDMREENGRTIRENNLAVQHKIPIGTLVEVKYSNWFGDGSCQVVHARLWVIGHGRDCDGTPLYTLASKKKSAVDEVTAEFGKLFAEFTCGVVHNLGEESLSVMTVTPELLRGDNALTVEES